MYQTEHWRDVLKLRAASTRQVGVSQTVLLLGLTSLFTDISSEMVSTVLPIYLLYVLHLNPLQFGVLDGLYQGVASAVRLIGGYSADRLGRHKEVAGMGYGLSAVCKLGLLAAGGALTFLVGVIVLDRIGKGIRTAPRDAMIALSTPTARLATAFGVHRALDTTGAMIGPLVAFGILAAMPNGYDVIFVSRVCIAIVGLAALVLFVPAPRVAVPAQDRPSIVQAASSVIALPPFRALVVTSAAISLVTASDGFVYLALQRKLDLSTGAFPLLYVAAALVYLLIAVPIGQLADRYGRATTFIAGCATSLLLYLLLLLPIAGIPLLVGCLVLIGIAAAATDGVLVALASATLPQHLQGSGLALLTTVTGLGRLLASIAFGALWTFAGLDLTIAIFLAGLLGATGLAWLMIKDK
jgi:MFS family permease